MQAHRIHTPLLWRRAAPFLTALVLGASLSAQAVDDGAASEALPSPDRASVIARSHALAWTGADGSRLLGAGNRYQAEFEAGGMTFTPALGSAAPHDLPLRLSLQGIVRAGAPLFRASAAPLPSAQGERVSYSVGAGVEERWDVTQAGVQLSYVFPTRPAGGGDLIVRLGVESELFPAGPATDEGLLFHRPGIGGVSIGAVTGIDARGETVPGSLRFVEGSLELVLPGEFVDRATYPLVLDPLIAASFSISNPSSDDSDPDVAYEGTAGSYLVVWEERLSATSALIRGQRVNFNGALLGGTIFISSGAGTLAREPRVAAVGGNQNWIVVYRFSANIFVVPNIVAVNVGTNGSVSAQATISPSANSQLDPEIGGVRSAESFNTMVVWEEAGVGIRARRVGGFGGNAVPLGLLITVDTPFLLVDPVNPAISRGFGESGVWMIAWERPGLVGDGHIYGTMYNQFGVRVGGAPRRVSAISGATDSANPSVDGDGEYFVVAWEKEEPGGGPERDVVAVSVQLRGGLRVESVETPVEDHASDDEFAPSVAWTGANAVVAFIDMDPGSSNLYMKSIDPYGCQPCEDEFALETGTLPTRSVRVASGFHGGDPTSPSDDVLVVSESEDAGNSSVLGQLYDPPKDGFDLGGATANGGAHHNPCAIGGNASFEMRLQDGPANSPAFLVVSPNLGGFGCGNGSLLPAFNGSQQVFTTTTDGDGDAVIAIPIPLSAAGWVFYSQWGTVSPGGDCPLLMGMELSNALVTTIVP